MAQMTGREVTKRKREEELKSQLSEEEEEEEETGLRLTASPGEADPLGLPLSSEEAAKREQWAREQEELKARLSEEDGEEVEGWRCGDDPFARLHYVAGVDISFEKEHPEHACAMLVILSFPELKVVHVSKASVEMKEPYIPGFLAFREAAFLLELLDGVRHTHPELVPQVLLVDGNGVLHSRGFGLACHLGVLSGIPTVGVGKKLFFVDGLERGPEHRAAIQQLRRKGDSFPLKGMSGRVWGMALRTSDDATNPVYVSVGHKISLGTAVALTVTCSLTRVPEPIRQADIQSREELRKP